ncbi:ERAD-associated E3 ubiquitin-protein ligase doa10 [Sphaceloma murrayae]|uniref:Altered inheritance of mitochondria protein 24, mitochondrial n=1 Tax=Sphaceloma murrayae TaxID=2082308 RepID=A0A2K1QVR0_9PEZI|nr:ERAD-associated E3 ubiquitin-protein ligase doa10 [Sphaceloma murrayae]
MSAAQAYYPPPPGGQTSPSPHQSYHPPPASEPIAQQQNNSYGGGSHTQYYPPPGDFSNSRHSYSVSPPLPEEQHFTPPPQPQAQTHAPSPTPQKQSLTYTPPTQHYQQPFQSTQQQQQQQQQQQVYSPPPHQQTFTPPPQHHLQQQQQYEQSQQSPPPQIPLQHRQSAYASPPQSPPLDRTTHQISNLSLSPTPVSQAPSIPNPSSDEVGTFNGGSYRISHRSTNTLLTLQLAINCPLIVRPGVMIGMSPTLTVSGSVKFNFKKLLAGGTITQSTYTGPGELLLAPHTLGDVVALRLDGSATWRVGRDSWVATTQGVVKDMKSQTLGKAIFSGEGLWTYTMGGTGVVWVASFGAILRRDLRDGEKYIIDNGHLVAWNCKYNLERVASGGIISDMSAGEGLVCKFTGPGTVYMQTRNPQAFTAWMSGATLGKQ